MTAGDIITVAGLLAIITGAIAYYVSRTPPTPADLREIQQAREEEAAVLNEKLDELHETTDALKKAGEASSKKMETLRVEAKKIEEEVKIIPAEVAKMKKEEIKAEYEKRGFKVEDF